MYIYTYTWTSSLLFAHWWDQNSSGGEKDMLLLPVSLPCVPFRWMWGECLKCSDAIHSGNSSREDPVGFPTQAWVTPNWVEKLFCVAAPVEKLNSLESNLCLGEKKKKAKEKLNICPEPQKEFSKSKPMFHSFAQTRKIPFTMRVQGTVLFWSDRVCKWTCFIMEPGCSGYTSVLTRTQAAMTAHIASFLAVNFSACCWNVGLNN